MHLNIADDSQRVRNLKRYFGTRHAAEYVAIGILKQILRVGFHDRARPLLHELVFSGRSAHKSAREILSSYFTGNAPDTAHSKMIGDFEYLTTEHAKLLNILRTRLQSRALAYPIEYQLGTESSLLLYALVRLLSPRVVCETGVANGISSYFLLHALKKNGIGTLFSFDVSSDVGTALDDSEKAHWELTMLRKRAVEEGV